MKPHFSRVLAIILEGYNLGISRCGHSQRGILDDQWFRLLGVIEIKINGFLKVSESLFVSLAEAGDVVVQTQGNVIFVLFPDDVGEW